MELLAMFVGIAFVSEKAHKIADYWLQTDRQARLKGESSRQGRVACLTHSSVVAGVILAATTAMWAVFALPLNAWAVVAATAVNLVTHYVADRRWPIRALADALDRWGLVPGKGAFARLGDSAAAPCGTGAHELDQVWHTTWAVVAAAIAVL